MPVTIKVNGTVNSLVHKMSNGLSTATIPDVCKTPSPGGPVPVPYPNIAQSITLSDGTTSVKGDKMMAAVKGSKFALSNGDNAGVAGGVKSSTFMKEATWILYAFTVKLNRKNACRLTDKMFHNSQNAANLGGIIQQMVEAGMSEDEANAICKAFCDTQAEYDEGKISGRGCCSDSFEKKINKLKSDGKLGKGIQSEQPFFMNTNPPTKINPMADGNIIQSLVDGLPSVVADAAFLRGGALGGPGGTPSRSFLREVCSFYKRNPRQKSICFPDLIVESKGKRRVFDAKFSYESRGRGRDKFGTDQVENYRKISKPPGQDPEAITPEGCNCPGYGAKGKGA
ncbi:DUF4150 domain-containing protein [Schlegelella sp. S2-27]|uniref:DUF4150 domain-containing protein n=1 Tax=Caldimonas mangrovi TaxID=2944811 RepID=A0ABT0YMZ5_9BURK|nr:DUF4150 domain-containing protein [Caldimonas mangrovi]MCM5680085.1 DUF4150 domain-containing protein [Caldimonas mangrovi]